MTPREKFGEYLLLKKLSEDPLGETFRAGRVGAQGMEQVVLLRVLNGPGLSPMALAEALAERREIHSHLRSPNIGNGVDAGDVRGIPFIAYDYISGRDLSKFLERAAARTAPIPTDHAMLVGERIGLALASAYGTRYRDSRVTHGFVVPELVQVSNEGETRLLGFEAAGALATLAGRGKVGESLRPYLSPECLGGAEVSPADDVHSLGAILLHLLTGKSLEVEEGRLVMVEGASLAADGDPIPPAIADLLKKSLAPRAERIPDAPTWHKLVSKVMIEGGYNATTFNLAFFMHRVFSEDIDQESREIETETTLTIPTGTADLPVAGAGEEAAPAPATAIPVGSVVASDEESSKRGVFIGIAAALLAIAAGGYFLYVKNPGLFGLAEPAPIEQAAVRPTLPAPAVTTETLEEGAEGLEDAVIDGETEGGEENAGEEASAEEEDLQAQLREMVAAQSKEMEAKLQRQYDEQIKKLQKELKDSKAQGQAQAKTQSPGPAAARTADPPAKTADRTVDKNTTRGGTSFPPAGTAASTTGDKTAGAGDMGMGPAASTGSPAQAGSQTGFPAGDSEAATSTARPATAATRRPTQGSTTTRPPPPATGSSGLSSTRTQAKPKVEPPAKPKPKPPVIRPPVLTRQPEPRFPPVARRTQRSAIVSIKVLVNKEGKVIEVKQIGEKAGYGFDQAALDAAKRARYKPATRDGKPVEMWTVLRLNFQP